MKKEYQKAEIEILYFSAEDVITTSSGENEFGGDYEVGKE